MPLTAPVYRITFSRTPYTLFSSPLLSQTCSMCLNLQEYPQIINPSVTYHSIIWAPTFLPFSPWRSGWPTS